MLSIKHLPRLSKSLALKQFCASTRPQFRISVQVHIKLFTIFANTQEIIYNLGSYTATIYNFYASTQQTICNFCPSTQQLFAISVLVCVTIYNLRGSMQQLFTICHSKQQLFTTSVLASSNYLQFLCCYQIILGAGLLFWSLLLPTSQKHTRSPLQLRPTG
jgi:hypothetical protein